MLRVPLHRLQPGMTLARAIPVPHEQGRILLQRGQRISVELNKRLERYGIFEVWVEQRGMEHLDEMIDDDLFDRQRDLYWLLRRSFESSANGTPLHFDNAKFDAALNHLFELLQKNKHCGPFVDKLDSYDNYLVSHSVNVCYLAMLLGMKLERYLIDERSIISSRAKDLRELGWGCLFHDVGKLRLPRNILDKTGKLTTDEVDVIRKHPLIGYEMVKGRIVASAAQVVLNHHQRYDGGGYPDRIDPKTEQKMPPLSGKQIPIFSRIASVCDVYDAATTSRCYSGAKTSVQTLWEMKQLWNGAFDPVVEAAFYEIVPPFPLCSLVTLSDGSEAGVVDFQPQHPLCPKVRRLTAPDGTAIERPDLDEIDLSRVDDLSITHTAGVDIRPYLECRLSLCESTSVA